MAASVPQVKVADNTYPHGTRCPHGKVYAACPLHRHHVRTHLLINHVMDTRIKLLDIVLGYCWCKCIGIDKLLDSVIIIDHFIGVLGNRLSGNKRHKNSLVTAVRICLFHRIMLSVRQLYTHLLCCGNQCLDKYSFLCHMRA